jgi:hypothetical protein
MEGQCLCISSLLQTENVAMSLELQAPRKHVGFWVIKTLALKNTIFWGVTPWSPAEV